MGGARGLWFRYLTYSGVQAIAAEFKTEPDAEETTVLTAGVCGELIVAGYFVSGPKLCMILSAPGLKQRGECPRRARANRQNKPTTTITTTNDDNNNTNNNENNNVRGGSCCSPVQRKPRADLTF